MSAKSPRSGTSSVIPALLRDRSGNFGVLTALLLPLLIVAAGGSVDLGRAYLEKTRLQGLLDSATLAAVTKSDDASQLAEAKAMLAKQVDPKIDIDELLGLSRNPDGSLTATLDSSVKTPFLALLGIETLPIDVASTAIASQASNGACVYVLGNENQAVLINSGANVYSERCSIQVHSTANPAYIMNSGSKVDTAKFCVKGTQYIKNGGTLTNVEHGCAAQADPYAGKLPEPVVPTTCTTSGAKDGQTISLNPGVHCDTTFNGSPTITFQPGLHIIKGRMIVNSNATINAEGVTFYFPDVNSELRVNGGVKFTGKAPTSGTYKGILMFEKTSNAANNASKQQYIFNGSKGEVLEGIIYLPNRNVTYNSTTNQVSRISLVVNTMIMNSANWLMEPYSGSGGSGAVANVRLVK
ncbi:MAG: hypothetical protein BGN83_00875 [Rhizobium sp. 63-7]|nr:MAG: hypothetical protein BGN83_00875 [Rhizobium sp. 63-7]